jgi:hypothetical protein
LTAPKLSAHHRSAPDGTSVRVGDPQRSKLRGWVRCGELFAQPESEPIELRDNGALDADGKPSFLRVSSACFTAAPGIATRLFVVAVYATDAAHGASSAEGWWKLVSPRRTVAHVVLLAVW